MTLTPKEALEALAAGKKLKRDTWVRDYIYLHNQTIINQHNNDYPISRLDGFTIYEEPKPKVVRYKFATSTSNINLTPTESSGFYKNEEEVRKNFPNCAFIKRLDYTATEFES